MLSPQQFFIRWIEFSLAGAFLLIAAKIAIGRLRQPADRINVILMTFVVTAIAPLLMTFTPVPHWQLGLVAPEQIVATEKPAAAPRSMASPDSPPDLPSVLPIADSKRADVSPNVATLPEVIPNEIRESGTASSNSAAPIDDAKITPAPASREFDPWWYAAFALIITYGLAIAYFLAESMIGVRKLAQLTDQAEPAGKQFAFAWKEITEGRGDHVRLLVSGEIVGPMAYGSLRPTIMIPESIATGDPAILQFCLKHEWTHIENGDLRAWGMTWVCQFLIWFQPLFWMLRRDLRICQDFLADHRAAGDGPERIEYSALLLAFTKQRMGPPIPGAIAFFDRSSHLSRRIRMLLNSNLTLRLRSPRVFCVGAGIVLFVSAALFGAVRLNTADGGAQAAHPQSPIQEAKTQLPAQKEKPAEGDNVTVKIIRGSVVDQAGKPVAQAKLYLPLGNRPKRTAQATADAAGQFELKVPVDWLGQDAKGFWSTLWAYAPGYSFASEHIGKVLYGNANEFAVKIVLPPQEKTSFKILMPNGDPLRNALVQPHYYSTPFGTHYFPEESNKIIAAQTNAEGIATFSALQRKHLASIQIVSEPFGDQKVRVDRTPLEALRTIRLRAPGRIEGKLIAEKPEWVRGVRLTIHVGEDATIPDGTKVVVTDNEGGYMVPVIASGGPVRFYVGIDKALPVRPRPLDDLYLKAGETMRMDIPLVSATLLHGTIQWKSNGKPVPNADILVHHDGYRQREVVKTNEKGYYEARVLPGQIRAQVDLPNADWLICPQALTTQSPLQVPDGALKFELPKIEVVQSRDLTGTLVGEKNEPVPDKWVTAYHQERYYGPRGSGQTDAVGRFNLKVPEGMESTFEVLTANTGQRLPATVVQKNPLIVRYVAEQPVDPEPERAKKADVTLTGRALSEGKPLAGVGLTLSRCAKEIPISDKNNPKGPATFFSSRVLQTIKTKSDVDGRYRLSGLKAGDEYTIEVEAAFPLADNDWKHQSYQTLGEQAKGEISLPDLNLCKWTQTLTGIVVDSDGKPVSGVHVGASLQNQLWRIQRRLKTGPPPFATTDSAGQFYLENLPDAPLQIVVDLPSAKKRSSSWPVMWPAEKNQKNIRVVVSP